MQNIINSEHRTEFHVLDSVAELRQQAAAAGIPWQQVVERFRDYWDQLLASRAHEIDVRRQSWAYWNANRPKKWPFWRHGFRAQYGRRYCNHDVHVIRGWDCFADEMGGIFPEWSGRGEELWEFLMSDYQRLPPRASYYEYALQNLLRERDQPAPTTSKECDDVSF